MTNGGEGFSGLKKTEQHKKNLSLANLGKKHGNSTREKISESLRGKPGRNKGNKHSVETKNKISQTKKGTISWNALAILQLDKEGKFIKEWVSATAAAKELKLSSGNIWSVAHGNRKTCGGYLWKLKTMVQTTN